MKRLIEKIFGRRLSQRRPGRLSDERLKQEAKIFVDRYGKMIEKLSQE